MNPWRGLRGLPRAVWLLSATTLVNRMGTMALPFLLLYLTQERGWSPERAGLALLVYGAGALVAGPPAGRLADRFGHLRVLKLSLLSSGLAMLAVPFAGHPALLFPLIFAWAAFTQAFWPSAMALITHLAPEGRRKSVFSLHRLAINLGMSVGPAVGGLIAQRHFATVFWVDGLTNLASASLMMTLSIPKAPRHHAERGHSPWRDRRLAYLLLSTLPVLLVFFQIEGALPLTVVRDLGFGPRFFGLLFTVNTLLIVAAEVALNTAMAHWPHRRQLALGAMLYAAGFGSVALARSKAMLLMSVVVWTCGEMVLLPGLSDAVATLAPPDRRGEYMGLYSLSFAVSLALGPWLGVLAYARFGAAATWTGCLFAGLLSAALFSRFRKPAT